MSSNEQYQTDYAPVGTKITCGQNPCSGISGTEPNTPPTLRMRISSSDNLPSQTQSPSFGVSLQLAGLLGFRQQQIRCDPQPILALPFVQSSGIPLCLGILTMAPLPFPVVFNVLIWHNHLPFLTMKTRNNPNKMTIKPLRFQANSISMTKRIMNIIGTFQLENKTLVT